MSIYNTDPMNKANINELCWFNGHDWMETNDGEVFCSACGVSK